MRVRTLWAIFALAISGTAPNASEPAKPPQLDESGLYVQPWFLQSFLDLREDLAGAAANGKRLVIFWEQRGCSYCKDMHLVNLAIPDVRDYIRAHFEVLQLDLRGARLVKDFDGEELSESALAQKYAVRYTPTIQFFGPEGEPPKKRGSDIEVARLPGYLHPPEFHAMFKFVKEEAYKTKRFPDYLKEQ